MKVRFFNLGARWRWVVNAKPLPGMKRYSYRRLGRPRTVQLVASRYTDYAIPAHVRSSSLVNKYQRFEQTRCLHLQGYWRHSHG
jgi:hypothetical protein